MMHGSSVTRVMGALGRLRRGCLNWVLKDQRYLGREKASRAEGIIDAEGYLVK